MLGGVRQRAEEDLILSQFVGQVFNTRNEFIFKQRDKSRVDELRMYPRFFGNHLGEF